MALLQALLCADEAALRASDQAHEGCADDTSSALQAAIALWVVEPARASAALERLARSSRFRAQLARGSDVALDVLLGAAELLRATRGTLPGESVALVQRLRLDPACAALAPFLDTLLFANAD